MFAENLFSYRKLAGFTQKELAKLLSVSDKTVSHWENGISEPSFAQLTALKNILSVSYEELLE